MFITQDDAQFYVAAFGGDFDERILDARPGKELLRCVVGESARETGERPGERLEVRGEVAFQLGGEVDVGKERVDDLGSHLLLNSGARDQFLRRLLEMIGIECLALDVRRKNADNGQYHADDEEHAGTDDPATR